MISPITNLGCYSSPGTIYQGTDQISAEFYLELYFFFFKNIYLFIHLFKKGDGIEKERERNIDVREKH